MIQLFSPFSLSRRLSPPNAFMTAELIPIMKYWLSTFSRVNSLANLLHFRKFAFCNQVRVLLASLPDPGVVRRTIADFGFQAISLRVMSQCLRCDAHLFCSIG